jgi:hypothetical protein
MELDRGGGLFLRDVRAGAGFVVGDRLELSRVAWRASLSLWDSPLPDLSEIVAENRGARPRFSLPTNVEAAQGGLAIGHT